MKRTPIRRLITAAIAVIGIGYGLAGCSDAPGTAPADSAPPNPLLYEIASTDGTTEGWMLGTIHALPDGIAWRTETIGRVIDSADLLVVEIGGLGSRSDGPAVFRSLAQSPGLPRSTSACRRNCDQSWPRCSNAATWRATISPPRKAGRQR